MSSPTVSVILPVYNGANYLRFAIESVLNQTFRDFELIVIDDGSTDSTPDILRSYGTNLKYVRKENGGVATSVNRGIKESSGRYISWLSHDDVFLPDKLEKQVLTLKRFGHSAVCYTDVEMIDSRGAVIVKLKMPEHDRGEILRHVLTGGPICMASYSLMYDRRCVEEVGFYSEYWKYTQDAEMLMRLSRRFSLIRVPEVLVQVREHAERGIRSKKWEGEVVRFFREQLETIPLDELFPEQTKRSEAYLWLGDALVMRSYPIYRVAYTQYRRVLKGHASRVAPLLSRTAWLALRESYEILARAVRFVPLIDRIIRRLNWKIGFARDE